MQCTFSIWNAEQHRMSPPNQWVRGLFGSPAFAGDIVVAESTEITSNEYARQTLYHQSDAPFTSKSTVA